MIVGRSSLAAFIPWQHKSIMALRVTYRKAYRQKPWASVTGKFFLTLFVGVSAEFSEQREARSAFERPT
jgi:hypothetical protein